MRVQIEIQGRQYHRVVEGEVLYWGTTVERFGDAGADVLPVPCVVIRHDNDDIEVVALRAASREATHIKALPAGAKP